MTMEPPICETSELEQANVLLRVHNDCGDSQMHNLKWGRWQWCHLVFNTCGDLAVTLRGGDSLRFETGKMWGFPTEIRWVTIQWEESVFVSIIFNDQLVGGLNPSEKY